MVVSLTASASQELIAATGALYKTSVLVRSEAACILGAQIHPTLVIVFILSTHQHCRCFKS